MKVYIVTSGCYDEYSIERVFSNEEVAKTFTKWFKGKCYIEEYEIEDKPFRPEDGEQCMFIRIEGSVYPEAIVDIKFNIEPVLCTGSSVQWKGQGINGYQRNNNIFHLYLYRSIRVKDWDEDLYKSKLTDALNTLSEECKHMFAKGATLSEVERYVWSKEINI